MLVCLVLGATLVLGQPSPPADVAVLPPLRIILPAEAAPPPAPATPDRWLLMKALQGTWIGSELDGNRLSVSGWTDASFTASSAQHSNLPLGFNWRANEPLLQQNWLRVERTVVTSGTTEPTFGFRSDTILPGSDYRFTLPRGICNGQLTGNNGTPNRIGVDPIQFYGEAYIPTAGLGLDLKLGRFFAQFGVEANDAPGNQLCSHGYTFIYDPFTHTGLLGTLKLTPTWSVQSGLVLGSDVFIDPAAEPTFLGSIKWAPPGGRDSLLFSVIVGSGRYNQGEQFNNPEVFDLVWTHTVNSRLTYTLDTLFEFQTNVPGMGWTNSLGVVNYLTYQFTPRLSGTTRLEFFDDFQGQRTGYEGLYTAATAGLLFRAWKSVLVRPEVRYDYNNDSRPYENQHGLFTATMDVIVRW